MNGFSILMSIFGICIFLTGFYIYRGHDVRILLWRAQYKNLSKSEWKNIGKWTMIVSVIPILFAIIGLFLNI